MRMTVSPCDNTELVEYWKKKKNIALNTCDFAWNTEKFILVVHCFAQQILPRPMPYINILSVIRCRKWFGTWKNKLGELFIHKKSSECIHHLYTVTARTRNRVIVNLAIVLVACWCFVSRSSMSCGIFWHPVMSCGIPRLSDYPSAKNRPNCYCLYCDNVLQIWLLLCLQALSLFGSRASRMHTVTEMVST